MTDRNSGLTKLVNCMSGERVLNGLTTLVKASEDTVPLEQLRGDISRAGYQVARVWAIDPDARRLFFSDPNENFLYAEYGSSSSGFGVTKVGFQKDIAKEYDPVDLEPDKGGHVTTAHDESDEQNYERPGFIPSGTPGVKPIDPGENFEGESMGGVGFGADEDDVVSRDVEIGKALAGLEQLTGKTGS